MRFRLGGAASYLRCAAAERSAPCRVSALGSSRELTDSARSGLADWAASRRQINTAGEIANGGQLAALLRLT